MEIPLELVYESPFKPLRPIPASFLTFCQPVLDLVYSKSRSFRPGNVCYHHTYRLTDEPVPDQRPADIPTRMILI